MVATMTTKSKTISEQQAFKNKIKLKAKGEVLPIGMKMNGYETFTDII